jgi:acyl-CoA reductase-like NAD-dependent aldehyde dehydrogenase
MDQTYDRERFYIGGEWLAPGRGKWLEIEDPATEEVFARAPLGRREDARRALAAARKAFDAGPWPRMSAGQRSHALKRFAIELALRRQELTELLIRESGCTRLMAEHLQVGPPIEHLSWYADRAARDSDERLPSHKGPPPSESIVTREPVGVVAAIVPWNFPLYIATHKVGAALASGNTIVLKPASWTPLSAFAFADAAERAELPPGVLNVVTGAGGEVGEELASNTLADMVSFTGSTEAGKRVMQLASSNVKKISLELGGKSAGVVLADAPLDKAVPHLLWSWLVHQGQACGATTRFVLHERIHDEFIDRLVDAVKGLSIGDPKEWTTLVGPLIRASHRQRVEKYIEIGREEGATLLLGGGRPQHLSKGHYLEPAIFVDARNDMRIAQEEIFGPVVTVIKVSDDDEAVRVANDSIYGLAGAVWAPTRDRAIEIARRLRTGTVSCNGGGMNPWAPFGGYKQSGIGRELGLIGMDEFTEVKHLNLGVQRGDPA